MSIEPNFIPETKPNQILTIAAHCPGKTQCVLEGDDLSFEILITNHQSFPVGIPLAYLQKTGPTIELVDDHTKASFQPRSGMENPALSSKITQIPSGGSVTLRWALFKGELEHFHHPQIAVTAHIALETTLQVAGRPVDATSTCTLHITGRS